MDQDIACHLVSELSSILSMPFKSYISLFACISSIAASPTPPSPDGGRVSRRQTCQGSGVIQNTDTCSPAEGLTLEQAPTLLYPDIPDANNTGDVFVSLQSLANKGTGPEADLPPCQQEGVIENTDKCRPQYPETVCLTIFSVQGAPLCAATALAGLKVLLDHSM